MNRINIYLLLSALSLSFVTYSGENKAPFKMVCKRTRKSDCIYWLIKSTKKMSLYKPIAAEKLLPMLPEEIINSIIVYMITNNDDAQSFHQASMNIRKIGLVSKKINCMIGHDQCIYKPMIENLSNKFKFSRFLIADVLKHNDGKAIYFIG